MSVEVERATVPCTVCGARVVELRRGRCWGCYQQWSELRAVGRGAACSVCGERRRDHLRLVELHNRSVPLCHGCAARTHKMNGVPMTLEALRAVLRRDRRDVERRGEGFDHRIFPRERRVGDRRDAPRPGGESTDPHIFLSDLDDLDDLVIEIDEGDIEEVEQTLVKERPTR
jgi:hypothetical protein